MLWGVLMENLRGLLTWMEGQDYHSHDWYDTRAKIIERSPKVIRAGFNRTTKMFPEMMFGIKKTTKAPMAMGLIASTYFMIDNKEKGVECLEWLYKIATPEEGWGLPFVWSLPEGILAPAHTGLTTIMPYILEGFERGYKATKDKRYRDRIIESEKFFHTLHYTHTSTDAMRSSYTKLDNFKIINASSYTALCLKIIYHYHKDRQLKNSMNKLVNYVISQQREDGSWPYWEEQSCGVDSLHQMYIIENLYGVGVNGEPIKKAIDYFNKNLVTEEGLIRKFPNNNHYFELIDQAEYQIMAHTLKLDREVNAIRDAFGLNNKPYFSPYKYYGRKITTPFIRWGLSQLAYASALTGEDI